MRNYRVPRPSRLVLLGLFLAVLGLWAAGAVFQNAKARTSESPERRPVQSIVIGGVVTASQCAPCHGETQGSFTNPVLRFEHDVHLARGLECSSCHTEFPHTVRQTSIPSMETCFNCHNQDHPSIGVLAPGDCSLCHTSSFHEAPGWHSEEFRDGGHASVALQGGSFSCADCHREPDFCVSCHAAREVRPATHGVTGTKGATALAGSRCLPCHADLAESLDTLINRPTGERDRGLIIHRAHLDIASAETFTCDRCHDQGVSPASFEVCTTCHGRAGGSPTAPALAEGALCLRCHTLGR